MDIYKEQDKNVRKTWFLMALFFVVIIGIGWTFSYVYNNQGILVFAVLLSVLMNIGSYWFSDKIVLAISGAKPISHEDNPDLYHIVENLCITAGIPVPKLYIINDPSPNAFATGRNKKHSAVAVTSGLLQLLDQNELQGVIAHELSHIENKDILLSTVVVVLVGFVALLSDFFLRRMMFFGGGRDDGDSKGGAIIAVIGIVLAILSPIIATLIQLAISRKREFLADASGALLTRYPEGLASALEKISSYGRPLRNANNATAHLFISNPFGSRATHGVSKLFMTHPPTEDRVRALRGARGI